jgi:hypothetical protein
MTPTIFYHLYAQDENYKLWIDEQFNLLKSSELINESNLNVCIVTPKELQKDVISYVKKSIPFTNILEVRDIKEKNIYEGLTLQHLYNFSFTNDCPILYFHSKGMSHPIQNKKYFPNKNSYDWRSLMQYFCIKKYKDCLTYLKEYDIVGVNWTTHPVMHFSGNFWWANSSYIRTLPHPLDTNNVERWSRCSMEFWIGFNSPKYYSFHNSNIDHYHNEYSIDRYI